MDISAKIIKIIFFIKNQTAQMLSRLYVISPLSGLPQSVTGTTVGLSAAIAAASAFPHCSRSVSLVYQIFSGSNEKFLNNPKTFMQNRKRWRNISHLFCHYAGYRLVMRISRGNTRVKILIAQGYMAFREQNISRRQAAVSPKGPMTARSRVMV